MTFSIIAGFLPPAFGIVMVFATYFYLDNKIAESKRISSALNPLEPTIQTTTEEDSPGLPDTDYPK